MGHVARHSEHGAFCCAEIMAFSESYHAHGFEESSSSADKDAASDWWRHLAFTASCEIKSKKTSMTALYLSIVNVVARHLGLLELAMQVLLGFDIGMCLQYVRKMF